MESAGLEADLLQLRDAIHTWPSKNVPANLDAPAAGEELRAESADLEADLLQLRKARRLCQAAQHEVTAAAADAAAAAPGRAAGGCQQAPPRTRVLKSPHLRFMYS